MITSFVCAALVVQTATGWLLNAQGGFGPTFLSAEQPGPATAAMAVVVVVLLVSMLGARTIVGPLRAMGAVGAGLAWGGLDLDTMRLTLSLGAPGPAALDGIAWTLVVLGLGWAMFATRGGDASVQADDDGTHPDPLASSQAVRAAAVGAIAGLLAVWLVAQSDLRQQTAIAAVAGGFACGLAGRLAAPHCQPVLLPPALMLGGTLAGWAAWFAVPADLAGSIAAGGLPNLLLPLPIDWAAGALFGVPMGFAAAHGFLHHEDGSNAATT